MTVENSEEIEKIKAVNKLVMRVFINASFCINAPKIDLVHNRVMRTSITLDDDVHEYAVYYANARGITLSAALNQLVRQAEAAPKPKAEILIGPNGLPMFPPAGVTITSETVKKLEEEEFDPAKFA